MPAKPTVSKTATKSMPAVATPAKKTAKTSVAEPIPARAEPAKTVKLSRSSGANTAQVTRRRTTDTRISAPLADRDRLIAEAAYYRAEARGFSAGDDQSDWFSAAQEVDAAYRFEA